MLMGGREPSDKTTSQPPRSLRVLLFRGLMTADLGSHVPIKLTSVILRGRFESSASLGVLGIHGFRDQFILRLTRGLTLCYVRGTLSDRVKYQGSSVLFSFCFLGCSFSHKVTAVDTLLWLHSQAGMKSRRFGRCYAKRDIHGT